MLIKMFNFNPNVAHVSMICSSYLAHMSQVMVHNIFEFIVGG
jgi:hypothetical protein